MKKELFVLDLSQPLTTAPQIQGYHIDMPEPTQLHVTVPKDLSLNALFTQLDQQNIQVLSLKNKSNRLEQLFMELVNE